jgi:hypothetical protein
MSAHGCVMSIGAGEENPFLSALSALGVEAKPPRASRSPARVRAVAAAPRPVVDMAAHLGLSDPDEHERVCTAARATLAEMGHEADVKSFRFGRVVVEGSPAGAARMRMDLDRISSVLAGAVGGDAPSVVVRVKRRN